MSWHDVISGLNEGADFYHRLDPAQPLSAALISGLDELCDRVENAAEDAIVVIHLAGRDPADDTRPQPEEWPGDVGIHTVSRWERALRRIERLDAVTVAMAEGGCGGPALEVMLATDCRIAGTGTRLWLPMTDGEFWPGMAVHRLANQIGVAATRRLLLSDGELSLPLALRLGLINELADEPLEEVHATAERVGQLGGAEFGIRRRLLLEAPATSYEEAIGAHLAACDRALRRARAERDPVGTP
jgi:isomerase DpgB